MYKLRRRRAGPAAIPLLRSNPHIPASAEHASIEILSTLKALEYQPKIDIQSLAGAPREYIGKGGSFRVEKAYIGDGLGQLPRAVVIKHPLHVQDNVPREHKWKDIRLEVQALLHPPIAACRNIVDLLTIGWEAETVEDVQPILVMPYATFGTLGSFLLNFDPPNSWRYAVSFDIACALDVLHGCGIVHGDLKSENVLVFFEDSRPLAKLSDFGCSIASPRSFEKIAAGTPPWNCPEWRDVITKENLLRTDIYSFGLLVWRILSKVPDPFQVLDSFAGISDSMEAAVEKMKSSKDDRLLEEIKQSLRANDTSPSTTQLLEETLNNSIRHNPSQRDLAKCLASLEALLKLQSEDAMYVSLYLPTAIWFSDSMVAHPSNMKIK